MKDIPDKSVDCIITDPPYELELHGGGKNGFKDRQLIKDKHIDFISKGFDYETIFNEFIRVSKNVNLLIFCSNKQISKTMSFFENKKLSVTLLVWEKTNPSPLCNGKYLSDTEYIVYVRGKCATFNSSKTPFDYKRKVIKSPVVSSKNRYHPTQKPIEILKQYIELHSNNGDTILDPFMGSGSTGVACVNTNRDFVGIELDDKYFEIAKKRIEQAQKNREYSLFANN